MEGSYLPTRSVVDTPAVRLYSLSTYNCGIIKPVNIKVSPTDHNQKEHCVSMNERECKYIVHIKLYRYKDK